mgnify:CR=1 FL=1
MKKLTNLVWNLRIWKDTRGQDLIEIEIPSPRPAEPNSP